MAAASSSPRTNPVLWGSRFHFQLCAVHRSCGLTCAERRRVRLSSPMSPATNVSRAHLMKVVNIPTRTGYLRSGGFTLAKPPEAINLGAVVRATEPDFALVECFATGNQCKQALSVARCVERGPQRVRQHTGPLYAG
jgi:DNA-binding IscR family transcriptional regulator